MRAIFSLPAPALELLYLKVRISIPDVGSKRKTVMLHASGYVSGIVDGESLDQRK
jgi:hypothetical protein